MASGLILLVLAGAIVVWSVGGWHAHTTPPAISAEIDQGAGCRLLKVAADALNIFKEPRSTSEFVDRLGRNDVICVARDRQVGDLAWVNVLYRLEKGGEQKRIEGWVLERSLTPASAAELAALRASQNATLRASPESAPPAPGSPPPSEPPPAEPGVSQSPAPPEPSPPQPPASTADTVRFSEPIEFGPPPVNGHSLEELIAGIPFFPPFEGLPESAWQRHCNSCHKWDRQTLCEQARVYVRNPQAALRIPHPYGGPEKTAMMKWAEGGCQ